MGLIYRPIKVWIFEWRYKDLNQFFPSTSFSWPILLWITPNYFGLPRIIRNTRSILYYQSDYWEFQRITRVFPPLLNFLDLFCWITLDFTLDYFGLPRMFRNTRNCPDYQADYWVVQYIPRMVSPSGFSSQVKKRAEILQNFYTFLIYLSPKTVRKFRRKMGSRISVLFLLGIISFLNFFLLENCLQILLQVFATFLNVLHFFCNSIASKIYFSFTSYYWKRKIYSTIIPEKEHDISVLFWSQLPF